MSIDCQLMDFDVIFIFKDKYECFFFKSVKCVFAFWTIVHFFIKLPDNVPLWYYWGETKSIFQFQISIIFVNFFLRSVAFTVNIVTINVVRINKKLHSPLNFLIASLCVADAFAFIYGIAVVTYTITIRVAEQNVYISNTGVFINDVHKAPWLTVVCYISIFSNQASSSGNVIHLSIMGLERLLAVARPMYWRSKMTNSLSLKIIGGIWIFITFKTILEMAFGRKGHSLLTCTPDNFFDAKVLNISIIGSFFLISIFTTIFYLAIVYYVRKASIKSRKLQNVKESAGNRASVVTGSDNKEESSQSLQRQKAVTKMAALVMGSYYILYVPVITTQVNVMLFQSFFLHFCAKFRIIKHHTSNQSVQH